MRLTRTKAGRSWCSPLISTSAKSLIFGLETDLRVEMDITFSLYHSQTPFRTLPAFSKPSFLVLRWHSSTPSPRQSPRRTSASETAPIRFGTHPLVRCHITATTFLLALAEKRNRIKKKKKTLSWPGKLTLTWTAVS